MAIKSDIEIAQEHTPRPIVDIAAQAGVDETYLSCMAGIRRSSITGFCRRRTPPTAS